MTSFPVITIKIAITPLLNYVTKTRVSIYFLMFQSLSIKKLYLSDNYVTGNKVFLFTKYKSRQPEPKSQLRLVGLKNYGASAKLWQNSGRWSSGTQL